jgi:hypothetical protein
MALHLAAWNKTTTHATLSPNQGPSILACDSAETIQGFLDAATEWEKTAPEGKSYVGTVSVSSECG